MQARRDKPRRQLCSGPGKLGIAIGLGAKDHGTSLTGHPCRGVRIANEPPKPQIISDVRVGITKAAELPWRFLVAENPYVSVRAGKVR